MMAYNSIKMTTTVNRDDLLKKLKENLKNHSEIVQEARNGYVKKAKVALEKRLEQLRKGQLASLSFDLRPPADYSEVYKSTIKMLEWNKDEYVTLNGDEFRKLVEDHWDWTSDFFTSNASYSKKSWDWLNDSMGGALVAPPE